MALCGFLVGLLNSCVMCCIRSRGSRALIRLFYQKTGESFDSPAFFLSNRLSVSPLLFHIIFHSRFAGCGKYCGKVAALAARSFPAPLGAAPAPLGVRGRSGADTVSITVSAVLVPLFPASSPLYTIKKIFLFPIDTLRNLCYTVCVNEFLRRFAHGLLSHED